MSKQRSLENRIKSPMPEAMGAALQVLEAVREKLRAIEVVVGCDGNKIELVLSRQSFGGGTRAENYIEVRFVNSETIERHCEERPDLFLRPDCLMLNGIYINGKLVGMDGSFGSLMQEAVETPFFRIVEPKAPQA